MTTQQHTDTEQIGKRLVELCRAGQHETAVEELYADDCVSAEAVDSPDGSPRLTEGKDAIRAKGQQFMEMFEVHGSEVGDALAHQDRFACTMSIDVTARSGPTAGQRMQMNEICVYTVRDGKIVREEFFYTMDC